MNRILLYLVLLTTLVVSSNLYSQDQVVTLKKHYHISSSDINESLTLFEQAASNFSDFDQYRFLNERRIINFSGSNVTIELFSASELFSQFGKEISPFTIIPGSMYNPVDFMITNNDEILTIFPLYKKQEQIQY